MGRTTLKPGQQVRGKCPACGQPVVGIVGLSGRLTLCDPQTRIVIFDDIKTEDLIKRDDAMALMEPLTGKYVIGRSATKKEADKFRRDGNPGLPYTTGRQPHLARCKLWDGAPLDVTEARQDDDGE